MRNHSVLMRNHLHPLLIRNHPKLTKVKRQNQDQISSRYGKKFGRRGVNTLTV